MRTALLLFLLGAAACELPTPIESHYSRGCDAYDRGDLGEAIREFDLAIEEDPGNYKAFFNRAVALEDQKKFDEAERSYSRVLELQPGNARALVNLSVLCVRAGRDAEAVDLLRRAGEADPASAFPWTALGKYHESKHDTIRARECYLEGLKREKTDPAANGAMGQFLYSQNQFEDSLAYFKAALAVRDDDVPALVGAGRACAALGKRVDAILYLQQAEVLGRHDRQLLLNIVDVLLADDRPWDALRYLGDAESAGATAEELNPRLRKVSDRLLEHP